MYKKNTNIGFDINWDKLPEDNRFKQVVKYMYDTEPVLNSHVIINGLPIYFNKEEPVIGINLSGGADSSMLLFILCKIITELNLKTKIVASTFIRFWEERFWSEGISKNVIKYMSARFPEIEFVHEIGFVPTALEVTPLKNIVLKNRTLFPEHCIQNAFADVYAVRDFTRYLAHKYGYTTTYSGSTSNPDHLGAEVQAPQFRQMRDIDVDSVHSTLYGSTIQDPFYLINKDWVMAQYENFGLQDLREMTRSCSVGKPELDKKFGPGQWSVTGYAYSCGKCFFCQERDWAEENKFPFLENYHK